MNGHLKKSPTTHDFHRTAPAVLAPAGSMLAFLALALAIALGGPVAAQSDDTASEKPDSLAADSLAADLLTPPADAGTSPEGVSSKVLVTGRGDAYPSERDLLAVHFIGWSAEGDKLYSSYDIGKPLIMNLHTAFPGWRDSLEQMIIGEKRRIWLPSHLLATTRGPKGASIFDLELLGLKTVPSPPKDLAKAPAGAEATASGAATVRLEAGTGTEHPGTDGTVLLHYIGWTADGQPFDSSYKRGRPTAFPLNQIMPAFAEAVQMMVAGEKRRLWVPGPVARGNWVGAPKGQLVFDIDMVRIMPDDALQKMQPAGTPPPKQSPQEP